MIPPAALWQYRLLQFRDLVTKATTSSRTPLSLKALLKVFLIAKAKKLESFSLGELIITSFLDLRLFSSLGLVAFWVLDLDLVLSTKVYSWVPLALGSLARSLALVSIFLVADSRLLLLFHFRPLLVRDYIGRLA